MARFSNTPTLAAPGPTNIQGVPTRTFEGGSGFTPGDPHTELFNAAVSGFLTDQFYESGDARVDRLIGLVPQCEPEWLVGFIGWLRDVVNMRSASVVLAAEYARAGHPQGRKVVDSALLRADEPGEMLGYWLGRYGRPIPSRVKRGVADAVRRLYTERALLKYDGQGRGWRFGDVIEMVHPTPSAPWQGDLFRYALDRRRHDERSPVSLGTVQTVLDYTAAPEEVRREMMRCGLPEGFTWERLAGWLPGGMDAEAWQAVIPQMGVMALLRNLNNFDRAQITLNAQDDVRARITDRERIKAARLMPFRFLSAYAALEADTYKLAVAHGADVALENLPHLPGSTLVMVDCSGSMSSPAGSGKSRSPLSLSVVAGFMAEALARRCDQATIVTYSNDPIAQHAPQPHVPVLRAGTDGRYRPTGGTYTWSCAERSYTGQDRVVIITDEQAHDTDNGIIHVPVVTWNLAGYRGHHANHGRANRYLVAGFNDSAIQILPSVIQRSTGKWPWN